MVFNALLDNTFAVVALSLLIAICSSYFCWAAAAMMIQPKDQEEFALTLFMAALFVLMVFILWPVIAIAGPVVGCCWVIAGRMARSKKGVRR